MAVCGRCSGNVNQSVSPAATSSGNTPVLVEYQGTGQEEAGQFVQVVGQATQKQYGLKEVGDVFAVWLPDYLAQPELFKEV